MKPISNRSLLPGITAIVLISDFVASFSWQAPQRMNYVYFIRDQIENIKKLSMIIY